MRDIKFRAWDKTSEIMLDWVVICQTAFNRPNDFSLPLIYKVMLESEFELMQFTGLQDKNGKDIYEGDILSNSIPQQPYTAYDFVFPVTFGELDDGWIGWNFKPSLISEGGFMVIGNIHENPELLEGNNG